MSSQQRTHSRRISSPRAGQAGGASRAGTPLCVATLALLGLAARSAAAEPRTVAGVLDRLAANPTIDEVQRAALRQAAAEPRRIRSLLARLRWAAALPRVEVTVGRGLERDSDLQRQFEEMDELSVQTDDDLDIRCTARWDLDRLVFDPEEVQAARQAADQARRRRELLLSVTRMYYELLALRAEERLGPAVEPREALARALRIMELRSVLDGLTGGLMTRGGEP
jgi:hypothetical protein